MGFQWEPAAIWEGLLNMPTRSWPRAPIHGDLHAENVRVRGNDAIIIDLARATSGPPTADPACLEVWIAFELPPPCAQVDHASWLATVKGLYTFPLQAPASTAPESPVSWLHDSVMQIRRLAGAYSRPTEYAITLALYLMRRATFEHDPEGGELDLQRRTWAWILGCQLLEAIQSSEGCYQEAA
jgi:aminoglycoside phosphotransferase (APT) family kinase protein